MMKTVAALLMLAGSLVFLVSALGLIRMPDIYNRIQTGTKATTLGTLLMLAGVAVLHPDWLPKLILIAVFIMFTNPVSSHVVARAAHLTGEPLSDKTVVDSLQDDGPEGSA